MLSLLKIDTECLPRYSNILEEEAAEIEGHTHFFLSVRNSSLFPCLWTAASIFDSTPEMSHDVHLDPRAVLLHHPQCMQDLPDIQGEQHSEILVMNNLTSSSSTFIFSRQSSTHWTTRRSSSSSWPAFLFS